MKQRNLWKRFFAWILCVMMVPGGIQRTDFVYAEEAEILKGAEESLEEEDVSDIIIEEIEAVEADESVETANTEAEISDDMEIISLEAEATADTEKEDAEEECIGNSEETADDSEDQNENAAETETEYLPEEVYLTEIVSEPAPDDFLLEQEAVVDPGLELAAGDSAVNASVVNLYAIDEAYEAYLTIPSSCAQSFQLSVSGSSAPSFSVYSGDSVTVSGSGLIEPVKTVWYYSGSSGSYGFWTTSYIEGAKTKTEYEFGTSVILVTAGSNKYYVTVNVLDYAQIYAEKVMDDYIAANITESMSDLEKLEVITAFPAQYDYSASYSGYVGLIVADGGDCWASSSAILYLCDKAGLQAHLRYGVNDSGAGSGHRNVAVLIGSYVYIAEAGYGGSAPRTYTVTKENIGFMYSVSNGTATIVQYDGFSSDVVVPSTIDGYTVTSIGKLAFYYGETYSGVPVRSLTLPDTLTTLEDQAIENCAYLTSVTVPASVTSIGDFVFTDCEKLEAIYVADGNTAYTSVGGVLYDGSGETLLYYPSNGASVCTVPNGVKKIADYAFYYTNSIVSVILPSGVSSIGIGAFGDSSVSSIYFTGDLPDIGTYAFRYAKLKAYYPAGNATWSGIGSSDDYGASSISWISWNANNVDTANLKEQQITVSGQFTKTYGDSSFNLKATALGNASLTYSSDNTDVATVASDGTVTLTGAGTANILVEAMPNAKYMSASATVTVTVGQRSIENCKIIFTQIGTISYSSDFWSCIAVADGEKLLTKNTDYQGYSSSRSGSNGLLSSVTWTIAGKGNYTGTLTQTLSPISQVPTLSSAAASGSGIKLTWEEESGALGYVVYRKSGTGSYSAVKTITASGTTTWTDTNVPDGTVTYCIKAYTTDGSKTVYSSKSNEKSVSSVQSLSRPTITSLTNTSKGVKITWTKIENATGYCIYRNGEKIKTITGGSTVKWTDTGVKSKNGKTYTYVVEAYNSDTSAKSASKSVVRLKTPVISSLKNSSSGKMKVKWKKNLKATGYQIQYSTSSSFKTKMKITVKKASKVSKVISGLTKNGTYYVRVRSYKKVSGTKYYSAWSVVKSVKISK